MTFLNKKVDKKIIQAEDVFFTKEDKEDIMYKIEGSKTDTIKWMFIFWIGQLGATIAVIMFVFKKVTYHGSHSCHPRKTKPIKNFIVYLKRICFFSNEGAFNHTDRL